MLVRSVHREGPDEADSVDAVSRLHIRRPTIPQAFAKFCSSIRINRMKRVGTHTSRLRNKCGPSSRAVGEPAMQMSEQLKRSVRMIWCSMASSSAKMAASISKVIIGGSRWFAVPQSHNLKATATQTKHCSISSLSGSPLYPFRLQAIATYFLIYGDSPTERAFTRLEALTNSSRRKNPQTFIDDDTKDFILEGGRLR
ncbi:hypothetical protein BC936DRAFT_145563 [Jimgerdemannia flammicorona]|uniref:Uncharacterized protein n=1 Tax=Jimgerdemannia flammicorona TaxID=994334 RepID=A0A433D9Q3_9FUNG|nr:hypothetical protein BC936DRAFT_145563 [Jimgerdemannia flammicorona]